MTPYALLFLAALFAAWSCLGWWRAREAYQRAREMAEQEDWERAEFRRLIRRELRKSLPRSRSADRVDGL